MYLQAALLATKILPEGKKFIDVHLPTFKKASQIAINFVETLGSDSPGLDTRSKHVVQLSEKMDIVENGLNVLASYVENQFKPISQEISSDLNIIKGQNEILFLSNSINYFIESHSARTGIDKNISYALQYDITAVRNHLNRTRDLRFPGYLLHQCASLSETIKEMNIFYTSILNHGRVPHFTHEDAEEELSRVFGLGQRKGEISSYIPYELKLPLLRKKLEQKDGNFISGLFSKNKDNLNREEINDAAHEQLYVLCEELTANEELEYRIRKKLENIPGNRLLVESCDVDTGSSAV